MNSLITIGDRTSSATQATLSQAAEAQTGTILQAILESLDGILVLTTQGEWVNANRFARQICQQLQPGQMASKTIPAEIWKICQSLIESRELFPDHELILCDEIITHDALTLRVRVRWLHLETVEPCLLVTLEDHQKSIHNMAIAEAHKYGLTPSETKVWLLYRGDCSYKKIAETLYITPNTVKKHMKSIHAKRKIVLGIGA